MNWILLYSLYIMDVVTETTSSDHVCHRCTITAGDVSEKTHLYQIPVKSNISYDLETEDK